MIICFRNGRLGNQIFQYAALKKICNKNELILLIGFHDLNKLISTKNTINLMSSKFWNFFYYPNFKKINLDLIFKFLSNYLLNKIYFFNVIIENDKTESLEYKKKFCLFKNIKITQSFHAQSENYIDIKKLNDLKIKNDFIARSKKILDSYLQKKCKIFFIHIRKGDYDLVNHGLNISLPLEWYFKCIDMIEKKFSNCKFIICTDDRNIFKEFNNPEKFILSFNDDKIDFSLMSLCNGGIMSASSFSWWAAWFSNNLNNNEEKYFLAPKYWMGFTVNEWFPKNIKTKFINYIDV